jgi:CRISPR-associated protein Cas2
MYVVLVYDVDVARVGKVLKVARRYLTWIQNSVLEGELTEASFKSLQKELDRVINPKEDSVLFYILGSQKYLRRELLGVQKGERKWVF